MSSPIFVFLLVFVADGVLAGGREREETSFDQNYEVIWDGSFVVPLNQGKEIQLTMDKSSGYNKPFPFPSVVACIIFRFIFSITFTLHRLASNFLYCMNLWFPLRTQYPYINTGSFVYF